MTILASFEYRNEPGVYRQVVARLCSLPNELRPTHHKLGEDEAGQLIEDIDLFLDSLPSLGFMLDRGGVTYSVTVPDDSQRPLSCDGFLKDIEGRSPGELLRHMAAPNLIFGYACDWDEVIRKNRIVAKLGVNTLERWVGRDTGSYVPGFYWMTLLSGGLAQQHGVSLETVAEAALEHIELDGNQHLFRFYDDPSEWQNDTVTTKLCASMPGVFDISEIQSELPGVVAGAKNPFEISAFLRRWK